MATYQRETRVEAPMDEVWSFLSTIDGLEAITPDYLHLQVHEVVGADGEPDPDVLEAGTRVEMSIRPFGVGPRQSWTSRITERVEWDGAATFHDVMESGPFPTWEHTHRYFADGGDTVVSDRVEYELPGGPLGRAVSPLGWIGFEPMFRARHRRTKRLLE